MASSMPLPPCADAHDHDHDHDHGHGHGPLRGQGYAAQDPVSAGSVDRVPSSMTERVSSNVRA